jgi:hypothetical protein
MSGWRGYTDWYRNARANPCVHVQVGRRKFEVIAEPVSQEEVAQIMTEVTRNNPGAIKMWSRWSEKPVENTPQSMFKAAKNFPSLRLRPVKALRPHDRDDRA